MSEIYRAPSQLSVSASPAEIVLDAAGLLPDRTVGKTIVDVASGFSDVAWRLRLAGANAFAVDSGYADTKTMHAKLMLFEANKSIGLDAFRDIPIRTLSDMRAHPSHYIAASAEALPFQDGSVDIILNNLYLASLTPYEAYFSEVLGEWSRVLKRGGQAIIGVFPRANSTVPAETRKEITASKVMVRAVGERLVRQKRIRKVAERSHPIGNVICITK